MTLIYIYIYIMFFYQAQLTQSPDNSTKFILFLFELLGTEAALTQVWTLVA